MLNLSESHSLPPFLTSLLSEEHEFQLFIHDFKNPDINFIAADYQAPSCSKQICEASAVLPLKDAFWYPDDGYQFIISVGDNQLSTLTPLTIEEIQVKLIGSNLWQAIEHKLQFLWLKLTR